MINLNLSPDAVLTLSEGDLVSVNGVEMVFGVSDTPDKVFISTVNNEYNEYYNLLEMFAGEFDFDMSNKPESEIIERMKYIRHVRELNTWVARMTRSEMYRCLSADMFTIS